MVPLYDYCCPQGHVFEQMATIAARAQQACPACGQAGDKIPSRVTLGGRADPGPSKEQMPQTWRGTYEGNRVRGPAAPAVERPAEARGEVPRTSRRPAARAGSRGQ